MVTLAWTGLIWPRIETGDGQWTFEFHTIRGISRLAEKQLAF